MPTEDEGFEPEERRADADVSYPIADEDLSFPEETGTASVADGSATAGTRVLWGTEGERYAEGWRDCARSVAAALEQRAGEGHRDAQFRLGMSHAATLARCRQDGPESAPKWSTRNPPPESGMSVPQQAIDAAMAAADEYVASRPHPDPIGIAGAVLEAAAPLIAAAERQRIFDQLGHDYFVIFTEDGWTVEHSVDGRLAGDMTTGCDYWTALKYADVTDAPDPEMLGRWRIDGIDSEGLPSLTRADLTGEAS